MVDSPIAILNLKKLNKMQMDLILLVLILTMESLG
jgi:hypothetical protein